MPSFKYCRITVWRTRNHDEKLAGYIVIMFLLVYRAIRVPIEAVKKAEFVNLCCIAVLTGRYAAYLGSYM